MTIKWHAKNFFFAVLLLDQESLWLLANPLEEAPSMRGRGLSSSSIALGTMRT